MTRSTGKASEDPQNVSSPTMFYGSVPSVFGKPLIEGPDDLAGTDIAFLGVPWSAPPSAGRAASIAQFAGTALTPNAFRTNSVKYGGYLPELDLDVFEHLQLKDMGNTDVSFDLTKTWATVRETAGEAVRAGAMLMTIGGNAGASTFPVVQAIADHAHGSVAIVNLDAHGDNYRETPEERVSQRNPRWGSSWSLRLLEDIPAVDPKVYQHVGLRGPRNDRGVLTRFEEAGVPRANLITYREVKSARREGPDALGEIIARRTGDADRVWIAVDPDVLDMSVSPQFGDEPLGLSVDELVSICYQVGRRAGRKRFAGIAFMATPPEAHTIHWIELYAALYAFAGVIESGA